MHAHNVLNGTCVEFTCSPLTQSQHHQHHLHYSHPLLVLLLRLHRLLELQQCHQIRSSHHVSIFHKATVPRQRNAPSCMVHPPNRPLMLGCSKRLQRHHMDMKSLRATRWWLLLKGMDQCLNSLNRLISLRKGLKINQFLGLNLSLSLRRHSYLWKRHLGYLLNQ